MISEIKMEPIKETGAEIKKNKPKTTKENNEQNSKRNTFFFL